MTRVLALAVAAALAMPAAASARERTSKKKAAAKAKADEDTPPPMTSYEIELAIQGRESQIAVDRKRGITLLEEFIGKHASSRAMPEALYRLAALYWERSQEQFLTDMKAWAKTVDGCKGDPEACPDGPPAEPQLDLTNAQAIYVQLIGKYPTFRKLDTVRYLYGFSLRDQGKAEEAQAQFRAIIEKHPGSTFVPDSWLAIGDYRFYGANDWKGALEAYLHVLDHPQSDAYAMALFKTAWCHWKLGDDEKAIRRFKEVLDQGSDPATDEAGRKRLADLREEALEYLVQVIAEDETNTPKDIYDFLASIDGAQYSRKVLVRLGEAYEAQTRYDKSVPTYRFLVALDPNHPEAGELEMHVFIGLRGDGKVPQALEEIGKIHTTYGPASKWGKAHPQAAREVDEEASSALFDLGRSVHESAQAVEQATKVPDKDRYALAARAYDDFIKWYPSHKEAVEVSYLAGDIYRIKLGQLERAGDAYLRVGESAPVGPMHRDALIAAIGAY
jgi:tetratricopeptide (TPR) repeat protein